MMDHTLMLEGMRLRYTLAGQGPDVILVHGWVASRRMWTHLCESLGASFRCWALDLPGCGDSDKPAEDWYSIPNYTAVVREFMLVHGLERARIIGHSMGGMIGLDLAVNHPEVVDRLITINPVVTGRSQLRSLLGPVLGRRLLDWSLRLSPVVVSPVLRHPLGERLHPGVRYVRRRSEDFEKGTVDSVWGSGRAVVTHNLEPYLGRIVAPTLVILGDQDKVVPNREGQLAAARIPGARQVVLRAGHLPTDERPDETLQFIQEFMA
jgi:pimeloyl-ACP methyl ester carboxylesterase